jgi:hypothetical protein
MSIIFFLDPEMLPMKDRDGVELTYKDLSLQVISFDVGGCVKRQ